MVSRVGFRGYVLEEVLAFLIRNAGYRLLIDPSQEEVEEAVEAAHTTPGLDEAAVKETLAKYIDADQLAQRLALPRERWPTLRERLRGAADPGPAAAGDARAAGCPTGPSEIGLRRSAFKKTYHRVQMIRRRYTVLDLATETGILGACVDELFAPGGYWADTAKEA